MFASSASAQISYVDTSLNGSQKFVLRWKGKPYFMTNIQVRLDKLRYWWGWNAAMRDSIIAQAASDGFNTVSLPIHWYEVEPTKNNFNWAVLDEYLGLAKKYGIRVELLWFGANSGGRVQYLGDPNGTSVHLRTPDYVFYAPSPTSQATTSDYNIVNWTYGNWTLDLTDPALLAREKYVLGQVMAHIASWNTANGDPRTVVGVQLGNEVSGPFTSAQIASYYSELGSAVKTSAYSVWTRMNSLPGDLNNRINANEALRPNTNIDFVGVDIYGYSTSNVQTVMPWTGLNFRMIMEAGAEQTNAALMPLAALSGDTAFDYYDMISQDGHSLYNPTPSGVGATGFTPGNAQRVADIRTLNSVLRRAKYDLALNKKQVANTGLYVHNYRGDSTATTTGVAGVTYTPNTTTSQAVSVVHSPTEILLINIKGGTFNYPASLGVTSASNGYYDDNGTWVSWGNVAFTSTQITPPVGSVVRIVH